MRKMSKKLQLIAQTMLLLLLPAFVMRPVVVTVENRFQNEDVRPVQMSVCDSQQSVIGDHGNFLSIVRENVQVPTLMPGYSKATLASSEGCVLRFVSNAVSFSPQGFLILRI